MPRNLFGLARPGGTLKARLTRTRLWIEAVLKAFAFARPGNWFASKIPPLLAIAYLAILQQGTSAGNAARLLLCALFSICCVAIYGHVVNDIFDLEVDRLAGKTNRLSALRPLSRVLLTLAFLTGGFLPTLIGSYSSGAVVLLAFNYLWPTIYSIPVARLKERGLLGVACDALGSHITPTSFILALFATAAPAQWAGPMGTEVVSILWATVLGFKGILHHQIADRDNDIRSGIVTFATRVAVERLQSFLTLFNLWIELPVSALLTILVAFRCPLAVVAFLLYTGIETAKYELGFQFALSPDPATIRPSVPFANEMFYVLWMPMAAGVQLAVYRPAFLWIPLFHAVVFRQHLAQQVGDWRAILLNAKVVYHGRC